ncbi:hypothetical protein [Sphaerisporangium rhizosphaerae]|uniref:Uncharacterized protein n=1 Tax=Sphaerisporangium rhizosphaerae TaxID=2269375 RepID=A0ABW2P669_9ACTN
MIAAATMKLFEKMIARHRAYAMKPPGDGWHESFDRESAIAWAQWIIETRYLDLARGCLDAPPGGEDLVEVVSDTHDAAHDRWTISLRDVAGVSYKVTLGLLDGFPAAQMIERSEPSKEVQKLSDRSTSIGNA